MTLNSPEREHNPLSSERLIEALLAGLLIFLPLAFGGVEAWSQLIALGAALTLCLIVCIRSLRRRERFVWTWAYIPLLLFFALAAMQTIPLPPMLLHWIAPGSLALRERLLSGGISMNEWTTISLYPQGTRNLLPVIAIAGLTFVSVLNFIRHPEQLQRLLMTIALIGGAIAILALLQDFTGTKMIYWMVPLPKRATGTGGPFVNYNNFSQFMNLSIGAALAVFFIGLQHYLGDRRLDGNSLEQFITGREFSGQRLMLAVIACCAIAIPLSTSRAGTIAFALGILLVTGILAHRGKGNLWIAAFIGVAIFGGLVVLGFDKIYGRLSSLYHLEEASGGRWQMNGDVWAAIGPFLPCGIGLGAHEMVYPVFNRQPLHGTSGHLENDYLQLLEELGIPGVLLVLWFLACIVPSLVRSLLRPVRTVHAAAIGLTFGLAAVIVQSVTDFGQRIPAIACLSAVYCALILSMTRHKRSQSQPPQRGDQPRTPTRMSRAPWLIATAVIFCTAIPVLAQLINTSGAAREWNEAGLIENELAPRNWVGSDAQFVSLLQHATEACRLEPGNIEYRHQLDVYRWYAINVPPQQAPPVEGKASASAKETQPLRSGLVIGSPEYLAFARHIVDDLLAARQVCPTYGQLYCFAGQLELIVLHDPAGEKHIRQAYDLAPSNPTVCFVAGTLDVARGRWDDSLEKFRRCLDLGVPLRDLASVYLSQADRPDLAVAIAGDNNARRIEISQLIQANGKHPEIAKSLAEQAFKAVSDKPEGELPTVLAWAGRMALDRQQTDLAEALLRQAIDRDYSQIDWRIMYAQALMANGKMDDALHEVRVCLRINSKSTQAEKMLELIVTTQGNPATRNNQTSTAPATRE